MALTGWGQKDDKRRAQLAGFDQPVASVGLKHCVFDQQNPFVAETGARQNAGHESAGC